MEIPKFNEIITSEAYVPDKEELNPDLAALISEEPEINKSLESDDKEMDTLIENLKERYNAPVQSVAEIISQQKREWTEEDLRNCAYKYHAELHKQGKKYIKMYCLVNKKQQIWTRSIGIANSEFRYSYTFRPFVYNFALAPEEDYRKENKQIIVQDAPFANQCTIDAAIALGFAESNEHKVIYNAFPMDLITKMLSEPRFMKRVRDIRTLEEHRTQIEKSLSKSRIYERAVINQWLADVNQRLLTLRGWGF